MYEGKNTDVKTGAKPALATRSSSVSPPAFFQPKLTVNQPDDPYEREADAMAERVMQQVVPAENNTFFQPLAPVVQRKCAACEEEEEQVQRKESNLASPQVDAGFESYVSSLGTRGQPLAAPERGFFEPRFNRDFSDVRIHHDSEAARSAQKINALAYTSGHNIVFNAGQYQPGSDSGKRLLAHELTHVAQQGRRSWMPVQRAPFGDDIRFDSQEGVPYRARFSGPYSDEAIASVLYGDPEAEVLYDPNDPYVVLIDEAMLLNRWRPYFDGMLSPTVDTFGLSEEQLAEVALLALGNTLRTNAADSVGMLRTLYNNGVIEIIAQRAQLIRNVLPASTAQRVIASLGNDLDRSAMVRILEQELSPAAAERIARVVSSMRHDLALNVRKTGGIMLQRAAELIDAVRGQTRPTYEILRASGKSDAQIIVSATRTNEFVNKLPRNIRISGRVLTLVSVGISVYVIVDASPEDRARVIGEEVGGFAGGVIGGAAASAACVATGIATGGLALIVCGLVGSTVGGMIGRNPIGFLQLLDIAPHHSSSQQGTMYRLQGTLEETDLFIFSIPHVTVSASRRALVIATGMVSGEMVGGRGHYRRYQVVAANAPAEEVLGTTDPVYVPQHVLRHYSSEDLLHE